MNYYVRRVEISNLGVCHNHSFINRPMATRRSKPGLTAKRLSTFRDCRILNFFISYLIIDFPMLYSAVKVVFEVIDFFLINLFLLMTQFAPSENSNLRNTS